MNAFLAPQLPCLQRRLRLQTPNKNVEGSQKRRQQVTGCTNELSRARRLSLPTYRERRYLEDNYVERSKGRPKYHARMSSFSLNAWPLVVRALSREEQRRKDAWLRRKRQSRQAPREYLSKDAQEGDDEDSFASIFEDDGPLVASTESLLFNNTKKDDLVQVTDSFESYINEFEIPPWAYIVRVRAPKAVLGKRAVQRNRAKRRIRAAASRVCPDHARRGLEYVFGAAPEALTIDFRDLLQEVIIALKRAGCWQDGMTSEMLRREKYCSK